MATERDWKKVAKRGREDLFFFTHSILGYDKLCDFQKEWCEWITDFSRLKKMRLEPRLTFKSTIFTIAFPLWCIIQRVPIIRGVKGCNLRILIGHSVEARSKDFLREIDSHIMTNPIFRECYGDLFSDEKWTETQKTIATRTVQRKEPTFQVIGKSGELTSAHYDIAILDDMVTKKDRDSAAERRDTKNFVQDLVSLVHSDGLIVFVGTHWHFEDQYMHIMNELNQELEAIGLEPYDIISHGGYLEDGITPRYPELLDKKELDRLLVEKGSHDFWAQIGNKPVPPEGQLFPEEELKFFNIQDLPERHLLRFYGYSDPSLGKSSRADYSTIVVIAQHKINNTLFLLEGDLKVRTTEVLKKDIVKIFSKYEFNTYGFETNGFQDETRKEAEKELSKEGYPIAMKRIENMGDKMARIQAAESRIKGVHFRMDYRTAYPDFMRTLFLWPDVGRDDGPDSLEGILQIVKKVNEHTKAVSDANTIDAHHKGFAANLITAEF